MKIGILQPGYLPWLGFFNQLRQVDCFVLYDDVQYTKNDWRNRNRIKTPNGVQWLTVPVLTSGKPRQLIKDTRIDNSTDWAKAHLKSIKQNYSKARYFTKYFDELEWVYSEKQDWLLELDALLIAVLREMLNIQVPLRFSSELGLDPDADREWRLINICTKLGADVFLEGNAGRSYLEGENTKLFLDNGIKIEYQDYHHPVYSQLYGDFVPYLSVLDLLMNEGPNSLGILSDAIQHS